MSLTAGATLQNGKYLIQTALHQSDAGVSYRAIHTALNQPVVIQTLNPSLRQSPRFDQLRQQFLDTVRQGGAGAVVVRDCFEEDQMPYAVLEPTQTPIEPSAWMPFLTPAILGAAPAPNAAGIAAATQAIAPPQTIVPAPQLPVLPSPQAIEPVPMPLLPRPVPARRARWLPLALVLTACGAGLTGAAFAWKLRHAATTSNSPALFSREQSFPEKTEWLGEDPYADSYSDPEDYSSDSASPAIERRSVSPRRPREIAPEPEYEPQPRPRSRRVDRPERSVAPEPQPQAEEKPFVDAPPKVEIAPDPVPQVEAPPANLAPAAPEAPAEVPSPKTRIESIAPEPPAEPISQ